MHSSKAMAISESRAIWISMDTSGDKNFFDPSIWERKVTPSSVIFRIFPRLKT